MSSQTTRCRESPLGRFSRRKLVQAAALAGLQAGPLAFSRSAAEKEESEPQRLPLKIAHRAASMKMVGNFDVFKLARKIPGLFGVELQVAGGEPNLRDWEAVRRYKAEAHRWGMIIPSLAGIWDSGVSIGRSPAAGINLLQSVRAAELLGAGVILVAFFRQNAPDMNDESSYGPVVELLQKAAPYAAQAGVTLGLENSLSPADNQKLVDLIDRPQVKVYYDIHNVARYGYGDEAIPGIKLLGKERLCQIHVKNGDRLIEAPGPVDWRAAFQALNEIGYEGWYVFESQHSGQAQLIESTTRNIEFLNAVCRMPFA